MFDYILEKGGIKNKLIETMDKYGLLPHPAGNKIKSTTEFLHMCKYWGLLTKLDIGKYHNTLLSLSVKQGLLVRYPESPIKDDVEQHDNYIAVASSPNIYSKFKKFSKQFIYYGLKHFFRYDHREKTNGFIDWLKCFRQPYQIGIFTLCSGFWATTARFLLGILIGYMVSLFTPLWLAYLVGAIVGGVLDILHLWGAIILEAFKPRENTSGKLLMWSFSQCSYFYKFLVWLPLLIFKLRLRSQYGKYPMQELCKIYYHKDSGMELLAKFAEGVE